MILLHVLMFEGNNGGTVEMRVTYADGTFDATIDTSMEAALVRLGSLADGEAEGQESSYLHGQVHHHTEIATRRK